MVLAERVGQRSAEGCRSEDGRVSTSFVLSRERRDADDLTRYRDHAQLEKMRQLGMKPEDEFKLSMMREYISKLAISRQACAPFLFDSRQSTQLTRSPLQHPISPLRRLRRFDPVRRCSAPRPRHRPSNDLFQHSLGRRAFQRGIEGGPRPPAAATPTGRHPSALLARPDPKIAGLPRHREDGFKSKRQRWSANRGSEAPTRPRRRRVDDLAQQRCARDRQRRRIRGRPVDYRRQDHDS